MLKASSPVLRKTSTKKLAKISLLDSTINTQINELANNIKRQVLQKVQVLLFFAIQCDETVDVVQMSQLLVYVHFVGLTTIEEEMLFCKTLKTTTKAEDVLKVVDAYFQEKDINWQNL